MPEMTVTEDEIWQELQRTCNLPVIVDDPNARTIPEWVAFIKARGGSCSRESIRQKLNEATDQGLWEQVTVLRVRRDGKAQAMPAYRVVREHMEVSK